MIVFITYLRALAACFITNAHYTGIYPTDYIANGGLVGDVLFFAVSGFCLYNIRLSFTKWYGKRIIRVLLPVVIITTIYCILGFYRLTPEENLFWWFIYPTNYHFVASIMVLYIPFYFIMKNDILKYNLPILMIGIGVIYFLVYVFWYDTTYYHIDKVREPMIRFLFMEAMLLGAWFRQADTFYRNQDWKIPAIISGIFFIAYTGSKLIFSKFGVLSPYQFINQIVIFIFLYYFFSLFASLDNKLSSLSPKFKMTSEFIANLTLEIYLVQYVLIDVIRPLFFFPVNWIILTGGIVLSAYILHRICQPITDWTSTFFEKV